jgi:hypothetical protein
MRGKTMNALIAAIIKAIFGSYFDALFDHPTEVKEEYSDVATEEHSPDNPDDIFDESDF